MMNNLYHFFFKKDNFVEPVEKRTGGIKIDMNEAKVQSEVFLRQGLESRGKGISDVLLVTGGDISRHLMNVPDVNVAGFTAFPSKQANLHLQQAA